jgi:outer membrane protein TolC
VDYTSVVVAQASALSARQSALSNQASQLAAAVNLISALGGGWTVSQGAK